MNIIHTISHLEDTLSAGDDHGIIPAPGVDKIIPGRYVDQLIAVRSVKQVVSLT